MSEPTEFSFQQLLQQTMEIQQRAEQMRSTLNSTVLTGISDDHSVTLTQTAAGEFLSVAIDPGVFDKGSVRELEATVLSALKDLAKHVHENRQRQASEIIPGFADWSER
ncbi:YbaB/EbfC family nucleoid-associated protein [Dactylosporangium sp. CA-233914]|uniref:YbaB/EbfC family nucleoid-associated protein n=1 Tax=Dactylosporangium sp. CA-233914 TaxID=3239934 RepID=UPI003D8A270D